MLYQAIDEYLSNPGQKDAFQRIFPHLLWIDWRCPADEIIDAVIEEMPQIPQIKQCRISPSESEDWDQFAILQYLSRLIERSHGMSYFIESFVSDSKAIAILEKTSWNALGKKYPMEIDHYFLPITPELEPFSLTADQSRSMAQFMDSNYPAQALSLAVHPEQIWQAIAIVPGKIVDAYKAYAKINNCNLLAAKPVVDTYLAKRVGE